MQDRKNITQFWATIPKGMTADEFRRKVKMAALQAGKSQQDFVASILLDKLPKESK